MSVLEALGLSLSCARSSVSPRPPSTPVPHFSAPGAEERREAGLKTSGVRSGGEGRASLGDEGRRVESGRQGDVSCPSVGCRAWRQRYDLRLGAEPEAGPVGTGGGWR